MTANPDRLYNLLPVVHRLRDADRGYPLRGLLQIISDQVNLVEADIAQLYENWFIETCQDWVVPYIGSLVGSGTSDPRREVANLIHYRRRKGTLSLLEDLAAAVANWPVHAVEFYRLLSVTQNINYLHLDRGRTVSLRDGDALEKLGGPFDRVARNVDVRRVNSHRSRGRFNIPEVGVFVWRIQAYSVTNTPAYCFEEESPNCYLFSVLGNDTPLYSPKPFPVPMRRRHLDPANFQILIGTSRQPVRPEQIVAADLTDWTYRPLPDTVAVDPQLGRIAFPPNPARKQGVWVSYFYGFSADIGGGEYNRPLSQAPDATFYAVGEKQTYTRINDALARWRTDKPTNAVIEINDSSVYVEPISVSLTAHQTLQIRAANRRRPVIRLLDWQTSQPDDLSVTGETGTWFTLDGLLITGRGVQLGGQLAGVTIRHCTLVPGWGLHCDCEPKRPSEPSLELEDAPGCLSIEHSIVGAIQVNRNEATEDPGLIHITDSILDATSEDRIALGAPESLCAYATLTIARSTVFGKIQTHAIQLAENSIFMGSVLACRRQQGCVRFCYVPPGSRTPRRYECQPDLVDQAVAALFQKGDLTAAERDVLHTSERLRVEPEFNSTRYGAPDYCQLAAACACEIKRGAENETEMGAFYLLNQPMRAASLKAKLDEYTPAGMDAGIIYAS